MRTEKQQEIISNLVDQFGIDGERILFLNSRNPNEPWIPPTILEQIALQMEGYRSSSVEHDKFIRETSQVVYVATVTDAKERVFTRSGVATVGEVNESLSSEIDVEYLASGRALSAALRAAGFDPIKAQKTVNFDDEAAYENLPKTQYQVESEAMQRTKDLRQIHALAEEKGLIVGKKDTNYRIWLTQNFGVKTSAILSESERAQVINKLRFYADDYSDVPVELREEAMFA